MLDRKTQLYKIKKNVLKEIYDSAILEHKYLAESAFAFDDEEKDKEYQEKAAEHTRIMEKAISETSKLNAEADYATESTSVICGWLLRKAINIAGIVYFGGFCRIVEELGFKII